MCGSSGEPPSIRLLVTVSKDFGKIAGPVYPEGRRHQVTAIFAGSATSSFRSSPRAESSVRLTIKQLTLHARTENSEWTDAMEDVAHGDERQ